MQNLLRATAVESALSELDNCTAPPLLAGDLSAISSACTIAYAFLCRTLAISLSLCLQFDLLMLPLVESHSSLHFLAESL
jgi:hypothetical protein